MISFTALRCFLVGVFLGALTVAVNSAKAQPAATAWADPTRPAGALATEASASAPRAGRAANAASAVAATVPQLQSLQVSAGGRASALVDGRVVQAGDALGASRIVAIDADGLTLRDAKGRTERMLLITAAIAKRDGGTPAPMATAPKDSRPLAAALATGSAVPAGSLGRGGREGQRP